MASVQEDQQVDRFFGWMRIDWNLLGVMELEIATSVCDKIGQLRDKGCI